MSDNGHLRGRYRAPGDDEAQAVWLAVLVIGGLLLLAALPLVLAGAP